MCMRGLVRRAAHCIVERTGMSSGRAAETVYGISPRGGMVG